jgi:hypothetical protein
VWVGVGAGRRQWGLEQGSQLHREFQLLGRIFFKAKQQSNMTGGQQGIKPWRPSSVFSSVCKSSKSLI